MKIYVVVTSLFYNVVWDNLITTSKTKMARKEEYGENIFFFLIVIKQIRLHWIFVSKKLAMYTHLLLRTIFHPRQQIGLLQQLLLICIIFQFNLNIASTYYTRYTLWWWRKVLPFYTQHIFTFLFCLLHYFLSKIRVMENV